jgi:hypothetical protein
MFFQQIVDRRCRTSMVSFLLKHRRYNTGNSCNHSTSYANCVKVPHLGLPNDLANKAFDILDTEYWSHMQDVIDAFTLEHNGNFTIGSNGRSGGYLVLYESHLEPTGHKSICRTCGQRNFRSVANLQNGLEEVIGAELLRSQCNWSDEVYMQQEGIVALAASEHEKLSVIRRLRSTLKDATLGNKCGRCGSEGELGRANFTGPLVQLCVYSGRSFDQHETFEGWSLNALRQRVDLVVSFDRACDEMRNAFIDLMQTNNVVDKTIFVPKHIKVLEPL